MHGVSRQTATDCTFLHLQKPFGVWQIALIIKFTGVWHTFTCKRFSVSDVWYQPSDCHGLYMPSLTKAIRCLTYGVNHQIFWSCTYFHLWEILSVWWVMSAVRLPRNVDAFTYKSHSVWHIALIKRFSRHVHTFTYSWWVCDKCC